METYAYLSPQQAVLALASQRPLLRASDLAALNVPTVTLTRLVAAGKLQRVARGLYSLPGQPMHEHRSLAEVALRVPRGVVCLLSALRVHGMGTQAPFEVWLAMPHHIPVPRLGQPALRVVRMSDATRSQGVEHIAIDGVDVPVFSAAKTVADCFKYRHKIGLDVALEALRDGWASQRFTMDDLWHHATLNRVARVMRPYLESLTAAFEREAHIRMGDALAALGRDIGLTNDDIELMETAPRPTPWSG